MSIYVKYFIATLFCLFVSMFLWPPFMEISLSELSSDQVTISAQYPTESNLYLLQLAIGALPVLVLLTTRLSKLTHNKAIAKATLFILASGVLTWQTRIVFLNLEIKRLEGLASLMDNNINHTLPMAHLLLEHYFAAGLVLGTLLLNLYEYRNRQKVAL